MKLKKVLLSIVFLGLIGANAGDSNSVKHYGFSAIFGFTSETIIHKNFTSLNDIEKVSAYVYHINQEQAPITPAQGGAAPQGTEANWEKSN